MTLLRSNVTLSLIITNSKQFKLICTPYCQEISLGGGVDDPPLKGGKGGEGGVARWGPIVEVHRGYYRVTLWSW